MKEKIRIILEEQLGSLVRKNYSDQDGVTNRIDAAVNKIAELLPDPKVPKRGYGKKKENKATWETDEVTIREDE